MVFKERYWKYSLIIFIIGLGIILFRQITPFLGGLLGALTIYILVRKQMTHLSARMTRSLSALIILAEAILLFLAPMALIVWMLVNKMQDINLDPQALIAPIEVFATAIKTKTGYNLLGGDALSLLMSVLPRAGQMIMEGIGSLAVNLFVMVFVLYFMLIGGEKMETYIDDLIPFSQTNTQEVKHKINMIVRSNAIGIPLLAVLQGVVAFIGYLIFGAPNAWLVALLTGFATIVPMVGTTLVWIPVAVYLGLTDSWTIGMGMALYGGLIISQCDNPIRFILQKKMANIHPLITVFGVVIGLRLFGFMGIIFGPLLLSLFLLFVDIFKKEYLGNKNINS